MDAKSGLTANKLGPAPAADLCNSGPSGTGGGAASSRAAAPASCRDDLGAWEAGGRWGGDQHPPQPRSLQGHRVRALPPPRVTSAPPPPPSQAEARQTRLKVWGQKRHRSQIAAELVPGSAKASSYGPGTAER